MVPWFQWFLDFVPGGDFVPGDIEMFPWAPNFCPWYRFDPLVPRLLRFWVPYWDPWLPKFVPCYLKWTDSSLLYPLS